MSPLNFKHQSGVVLIVAMVLMAIITLVGISASQLVTSSGVSTTGFLDRGQAFQDVESVLREAEKKLIDGGAAARDCTNSNVDCSTLPSASDWSAVSESKNALRAGLLPEYFIEKIAANVVADPSNPTTTNSVKTSRNSSSFEYGAHSDSASSSTYDFYRVTARSHTPGTTGSEGRSVVVLQSVIKIPQDG